MEELVKKTLEREITKINSSLAEPIGETQQDRLLDYLKLLHKWNQAYNLTAVRDPIEMIHKHILDSLLVLPMLDENFQRMEKPTLADVGSGAGLPGIPLAIARPQWQITLIDSNGKKTGFLTTVKRELGLSNVSIVNARVESLNQTFDAIICRAFASLKDIVELTATLCHEQSCLWAMKGKYPDEELRALPKSYRVASAYTLGVPDGVDKAEAERHLLKIVRHPVA